MLFFLLLSAVLLLQSSNAVSVGSRRTYQSLLLHSATGAATNSPTGAAAVVAAAAETTKNENAASKASSTGGAVTEEVAEKAVTDASATGTETAAEVAADEIEDKAEDNLENVAKAVESASPTGSTDTNTEKPKASTGTADEVAAASGPADEQTQGDQAEDAKEDAEETAAISSAATGATDDKDKKDKKDKKDDASGAATSTSSGPSETKQQDVKSDMSGPEAVDTDVKDDMSGPEAVDVSEISDLVGAAATASAESASDSTTKATGGMGSTGSTGGTGSTGSTGGTGGTGGTGTEDDAPTGPAPTLKETPNDETKRKEDDEGQIEQFGDGVNPDGSSVKYAEVEIVLGISGMPCTIVKAKNKRFRPSISLAITGDVKNQADVLVTDTSKLNDNDKGCATSITLKIHGTNAAKDGARYAKTVAEGGSERLRESLNHYFHELDVNVKILQTPRVLAGNTASNAAMERAKAIESTNAAMFGVGESTAESLADHKYSNQRPHLNPEVQRLYRMKHKCKDQDCLLRIDEKLNDAVRQNDMALGSATDSIPVKL